MAIETCYESNNYRYDFDTLYGTGWFVRKSDDYVSLMETGIEAEDNRQYLSKSAKTGLADTVFDIVAERQTYSNRWTEGTER